MRQGLRRLAIALTLWLTLFIIVEALQYQLMHESQSECEVLDSRPAPESSLPDLIAEVAPRHGIRSCFYHQREAEEAQIDMAIFFIVFPILLLGGCCLVVWIYRGFYPRST